MLSERVILLALCSQSCFKRSWLHNRRAASIFMVITVFAGCGCVCSSLQDRHAVANHVKVVQLLVQLLDANSRNVCAVNDFRHCIIELVDKLNVATDDQVKSRSQPFACSGV